MSAAKTTHGLGWSVLALAMLPAVGTPEPSIRIDEVLLGSSTAGFAILRTEVENKGSYYVDRTKVFLDEYEKGEESASLLRSTLLHDSTRTIDAGHNDPETPAPAERAVHEQDAKLLLGEIAGRYSLGRIRAWEVELRERFEASEGGVTFDRTLGVMNGREIEKEVFGGLRPDVGWRLEDVLDDGDCLFLRVVKEEGDGVSASRLSCVPRRRSQQVRDWRDRKEVYLAYAKRATAEEAVAFAKELRAQCREKGKGFHPEVWSVRWPTDAIEYLIVDRFSEEAIRDNSYPDLERILGLHAKPIAGTRLRERFEVR